MTVVRIVLIVLSLAILLVLFIPPYLSTVGDDVKQCRLSELSVTQTGATEMENLKIRCRANQIEITKDVVKANGKSIPVEIDAQRVKEINGDVVNQVFADELARCWHIGSEGKADPFFSKADKLWKKVIGIATRTKSVCLICSKVKLANIVINTPLIDFLAEHQMPSKHASYYSYLGIALAGLPSDFSGINNDDIYYDFILINDGETEEKPKNMLEILSYLSEYNIANSRKINPNQDYYVMQIGLYQQNGLPERVYLYAIIPVTEVWKICDKIVN